MPTVKKILTCRTCGSSWEENKEGKGKVDEETTTENNAPGAGAV